MNKIQLIIILAFMSLYSNAQKPNVVFIIVDDLKPMLNTFGESQIVSPNFDSFAEESVVFTNAHAQQAVCAASRVSFMTGTRPDVTQVLDLQTHMRDVVPNSLTIPEYFKQNGYETAALGKVLHGAKNNDPQSWSIPFINDDELPYDKVTGVPADFQYQNKKTKEAYNQLVEKKKSGVKINYRRELNKMGMRPSVENEDVPDDAYPDGAIAKKSIELLEGFKESNTPFFLTIGFRKPHLPFIAPKKYWDLYNRHEIKLAEYKEHAEGAPNYAYHSFGELKNYSDIKENLDKNGAVIEKKQRELIHGYYASVSYVDAQLGKVLDYLKSSGMDKNTIVVLIGDHGWHLGDHGLWNKHSNYEQATRTPMYIMTPNGKRGVKNSSPTELIDVFPTICDYAGLKIPVQVQGKSLLPIVEGDAESIHTAAFSQWPIRWTDSKRMGYALRNNRYRYVEWRVGNYKESKDYMNGEAADVELYDYEKDPLETKNLVDDPAYAKVVKKLKKELNDMINEKSVD